MNNFEWISVEQNLPIDGEQVLVYIPGPIIQLCYFHPEDKRKFSCYDHFQTRVEQEVSHWTRIPEPQDK